MVEGSDYGTNKPEPRQASQEPITGDYVEALERCYEELGRGLKVMHDSAEAALTGFGERLETAYGIKPLINKMKQEARKEAKAKKQKKRKEHRGKIGR